MIKINIYIYIWSNSDTYNLLDFYSFVGFPITYIAWWWYGIFGWCWSWQWFNHCYRWGVVTTNSAADTLDFIYCMKYWYPCWWWAQYDHISSLPSWYDSYYFFEKESMILFSFFFGQSICIQKVSTNIVKETKKQKAWFCMYLVQTAKATAVFEGIPQLSTT